MNKLISVDFYADFGCLKKPDTNDPLYLTYNMLHRPALLGILGAIAGLGGFESPPLPPKGRKEKKEATENAARESRIGQYYEELKDLKVGIRPLNHQDGNFQKIIIGYVNGVGYANHDGGTLIIREQTLLNPAYRCYILFDGDKEIYKQLNEKLREKEAVYLPYLGKNEYSIWWDNWQEYEFEEFNPNGESPFTIHSLFMKDAPVKEGKHKKRIFELFKAGDFTYFERLPVRYNTELVQYELADFAYTNVPLKTEYPVKGLFKLKKTNEVIQLFS
jgi:CRISPR-associated protein Cas5h